MDETYFLYSNKKKYLKEKTLIKVGFIDQDDLITVLLLVGFKSQQILIWKNLK
jgi:hypothetical protein